MPSARIRFQLPGGPTSVSAAYPDVEFRILATRPTSDGLRVVLEIDDDADDRFEEGRYVGLNLLADMNSRNVAQGGVTPVVTGVSA